MHAAVVGIQSDTRPVSVIVPSAVVECAVFAISFYRTRTPYTDKYNIPNISYYLLYNIHAAQLPVSFADLRSHFRPDGPRTTLHARHHGRRRRRRETRRRAAGRERLAGGRRPFRTRQTTGLRDMQQRVRRRRPRDGLESVVHCIFAYLHHCAFAIVRRTVNVGRVMFF